MFLAFLSLSDWFFLELPNLIRGGHPPFTLWDTQLYRQHHEWNVVRGPKHQFFYIYSSIYIY